MSLYPNVAQYQKQRRFQSHIHSCNQMPGNVESCMSYSQASEFEYHFVSVILYRHRNPSFPNPRKGHPIITLYLKLLLKAMCMQRRESVATTYQKFKAKTRSEPSRPVKI